MSRYSRIDAATKIIVLTIACSLSLSSLEIADGTAQKATSGGGIAGAIYPRSATRGFDHAGRRADRAEYMYRYPLFYALEDAGYDVDFIGSLTWGLNADATWSAKNGVAVNPNHEGHYGWRTAAVCDKLGECRGVFRVFPVNVHAAVVDFSDTDRDVGTDHRSEPTRPGQGERESVRRESVGRRVVGNKDDPDQTGGEIYGNTS